MSNLADLVERVERLLVRHEELRRTNALLEQQVELVTQERDALKSRLSTARSRIDALLEQMPAPAAPTTPEGSSAESTEPGTSDSAQNT